MNKAMNDYVGIVEVQTLSIRGVNRYLEGGYRLLHVETVTTSGRHPVESSGAGAGSYFVRRALRFIVGRTAEVTAIPWGANVEEKPAP